MPLVVVPTPLGNLGDITLRAVEALRTADFILAEDTRHTRKLLSHLDIHRPLLSYYRPHEERQAEAILPRLQQETAALVSDSGTPAISDPGFIIIRRAIAAGVRVTVLPGPTAFVPALVASGISPARFAFFGFPPRRPGEQRRLLQGVSGLPCTLVFYESPRRMRSFLEQAFACLGDREFALVRELSKQNEQVVRGTLAHADERLTAVPELGELVIVVAGSSGERREAEAAPRLENLEDLFRYFRDVHNLGRNRVKRALMKRG